MTDIIYTLDEIRVSRTDTLKKFKVEFEEGEISVFVSKSMVEDILDLLENAVTDAEVALVLGYLEYAKKANKSHNGWNRSIKERDKINVTAELLNIYSAEDIIQNFREKKWHQIVEIYNSCDPSGYLIMEEKEKFEEEDEE